MSSVQDKFVEGLKKRLVDTPLKQYRRAMDQPESKASERSFDPVVVEFFSNDFGNRKRDNYKHNQTG